ncbi:DoxX family protein [Salinisphaera hydrothermalis]|uniref:DoxX family protein n=1 Tax=Salinisphaera hydrothermalis (strain C41B8) TaxID=1304275 RepID=A0A084IPL8_SALHC|nr:DoxX family protein [Salinisphaera hydrothermalis]KEZ78652.1 DoxX family protein [Salinisphaera hydrothermalis C41B8]
MFDSLLHKSYFQDPLLLAARVLIAWLFLLFGWGKLIGFAGTVAYMQHTGAPVPVLAAAIAVIMEVPVALAIALGLATRPLALLMALYTLGTALIGHPYWTLTGAEQYANQINFYKNIAIIGGLLALYVAGPGRFAVDAWLGRRTGSSRRTAHAA